MYIFCVFLFLSSFLFYLYLKNSFLLSFPCLFSIASVCFVCFLSYLILIKILKSKEKSKTILYVIGALFWLFLPAGRILKVFVTRNAILWEKMRNASVIVFVTVIFLCFFLGRRFSDEISSKINKVFSSFTMILVMIFGLDILVKAIANSHNPCRPDLMQSSIVKLQKYPNVYHILLDAHSSNYVLKKYYDFDNREFYQKLRHNGFEVVEASFSQYPATQMSVASMLNCKYLPAHGLSAMDLKYLRFNNKVFESFRANGYRVHVFDRTLQISYGHQFKKANSSNYALYWLWIQHTPIKWFFQRKFEKSMCLAHVNDIELDLEELKSAREKFGSYNNLFYAHIVCPHAPFVYGENGSFDISQGLIGMFADNHGNLAKDDEHLSLLKQKYLSTVKVIDKKVLKLIRTILSQYEEKEKPVIILHSDHGTCLTTISPLLFDSRKILPCQLNAEQEQLYGNLLSIYCPSSWQAEKTPLFLVNLYRFVFNNLFNEKYEYLENFCCVKD